MHLGRACGWSDCGHTKKRASAEPGTGADSPNRVIERLRELWVEATSPDGLALSPERFWGLTLADLNALREHHHKAKLEQSKRWALSIADFRNVHFRGGERASVPWNVNELLGIGETGVAAEIKAEEIRLNQLMRYAQMPGSVAFQELPSWAKMTPEEAEKKDLVKAAQRGKRNGRPGIDTLGPSVLGEKIEVKRG